MKAKEAFALLTTDVNKWWSAVKLSMQSVMNEKDQATTSVFIKLMEAQSRVLELINKKYEFKTRK